MESYNFISLSSKSLEKAVNTSKKLHNKLYIEEIDTGVMNNIMSKKVIQVDTN